MKRRNENEKKNEERKTEDSCPKVIIIGIKNKNQKNMKREKIRNKIKLKSVIFFSFFSSFVRKVTEDGKIAKEGKN